MDNSAAKLPHELPPILHWDVLSPVDQARLVHELKSLSPELINELLTAGNEKAHAQLDLSSIQPVSAISLKDSDLRSSQASEAHAKGVKALQDGRVAALTVAGGQGTRLQFNGPKGLFPITPITQKSLFEHFALKIHAAQDTYACDIPWFIMTSAATHEATQQFFADHDNLGLRYIYLFKQGELPMLAGDGKGLFLSEQKSISLSPDGHGGLFSALANNGMFDTMSSHGIDLLSYFQVDNPLVNIFDPYFVGYHLNHNSEISSKVVRKEDPQERVGVFCKINKLLTLIEYSDLPQPLAVQKAPSGQLDYFAGNIAVHLISSSFARHVAQKDKLPLHIAKKSAKIWTPQGISESQVIKCERFMFDCLQHASNPLIFEVDRSQEFSPVKNIDGGNSPDTAREDMQRQWAQWLQAAGVDIPVDNSGLPNFPLEICPKFADNKDTFVKKWKPVEYATTWQKGLYIR